MTILRWLTLCLMGALLALTLWLFVPPVRPYAAYPVNPQNLPTDLRAHVAAREDRAGAITPGAEATLAWDGTRRDIALVYLHGFSATPAEIRPVPELLAEALGANLYMPRLSGHGLDGQALADASVQDWVNDMAEALAIGQRIGDRVVLIGTSTGGTLAALAALDPAFAPQIDALVLISPNFGLQDTRARLLDLPLRHRLAPLIAGDELGFVPHNTAHGQFWTTRYPVSAVFALRDLQRFAAAQNYAAARIPALFIYAPDDSVVRPAATRRVIGQWGGPARAEVLRLGAGDDPSRHVLAGEILSPGMTAPVVALVTEWLSGL